VSKAKRTKKDKAPGNYIDSFIKRMFGRVLVFTDFLQNYADKKFVSEIDVNKMELAPTHYLGAKGDERIVDLVWRCPLKTGDGSLMAVIVFEHESKSLKHIPRKLHKYISAIWDAEAKEGKPLSAPFFIVLRTGKKPHRSRYYTMADLLPKDKDGKPIGKTVEVEYDVIDLPAWDFDDLTGGAVLRSALMMLHTMTGSNLDDFPAAFRPLLELPDGERVEVSKEMLDFVDVAFKAHNRRLDATIVSKALRIFKDKEQAMIKSIFDEKIDEGRIIGKAEGKAEGKIEAVLTVLRTRFNRVPKDVEKAIRQMTDPIALDSWTAQAAACQSMNEFAQSLK
jgi:hypothetical protein